MSSLWIDDFTTDHFTDGRYALLGGSLGGSFHVDTGLHFGFVAWKDPTPIGNHDAYMELDIDSWSAAPLYRMGFLPAGSTDWRDGLVLAFSRASADAGLSIELFDQFTNIARFYASALTVDPTDSPLVLRLAIDDAGVAYMGVGATGGFMPIGGSAPSLGGFAQLSEGTFDALATWVPYVYLSSATARRASKWQYGTSGEPPVVPIDGLLAAGLGSLGQMRVRPVN